MLELTWVCFIDYACPAYMLKALSIHLGYVGLQKVPCWQPAIYPFCIRLHATQPVNFATVGLSCLAK